MDVGRGEGGEDIGGGEGEAVAGRDAAEVGGGREVALAKVAGESVAVGRKVKGVAEDDAAGRVGGVEEGGEELVEVGGGLAGEREIGGGDAEERGEGGGGVFGVGEPGGGAFEPAVDAEGGPFGDDAKKGVLRGLAEEAEGITIEVDAAGREEELSAEGGPGGVSGGGEGGHGGSRMTNDQ